MVDLLCHEYGWTVAQVFDHNLEVLDLLLGAITDRKYAEQTFQAQIHGAKMKGGGPPKRSERITADELFPDDGGGVINLGSVVPY